MRRDAVHNDEMHPKFAKAVAVAMFFAPLASWASHGSQPPAPPVDINRATVSELLTVPGMTPSWAGRIVRFRPYRTKLELLDQGVLPPDVYQRIRASVIAHRAVMDDAKVTNKQ
jgi:DNA uptake protein ComE-like DNA-binding protein